jgi:hypothetical protein
MVTILWLARGWFIALLGSVVIWTNDVQRVGIPPSGFRGYQDVQVQSLL